MGKKGAVSWLTAVKKAFRSPTKSNDGKSSRRREEHEPEDEQKKREKRRWLFRKPTNNAQAQQSEQTVTTNFVPSEKTPPAEEERNSIAVAEAAVATAKAAMEIIRLTRFSISVREHYAATVIQTAFRGYLARRALCALKGIVKLQALVRGQNVRKQAKMTLKCIQALLRVQARVRDQRARHSHDGGRKSMFAQTNNFWESVHLQGIRDRQSISRDGGCITDHWDERPHTLQELEAILESKKEAALQRERSMAYAFSQQIWRSDRDPSTANKKDLEERTNWLNRWMAMKPWESSSSRASFDRKDYLKTVEIETLRNPTEHHKPPHSLSPVTPSPSKIKSLHVRSLSPRTLNKEKSYSTANTPSLRLTPPFMGCVCRYSDGSRPNYMAATESAKARVRPQSVPRIRPSTPERERNVSVKKRLSYPDAEVGYNGGFDHNLRSPSFKSVQAGYVGMGHQSNQSWYTDSVAGEISPCSTTDLRWLR